MKGFPCLKIILETIYLCIILVILFTVTQHLSEKATNLILTGIKIKVQITFLTE